MPYFRRIRGYPKSLYKYDHQARAPHHTALSVERYVVDVLVDGDVDREIQRVAPALDVADRLGCRVHPDA